MWMVSIQTTPTYIYIAPDTDTSDLINIVLKSLCSLENSLHWFIELPSYNVDKIMLCSNHRASNLLIYWQMSGTAGLVSDIRLDNGHWAFNIE